jgi:CubicO group peptidase (beta-lactamase class C family)
VQARVDALMRPYDGAVPGAALLVQRHGTPVVRRGYGYADLERRVPVTPESGSS